MSERGMLDRLDGIFALDMGCVSSGIKDDAFKFKLRDNKALTERLLNELAIQYLNDDQYDLEDIDLLIKWASKELDFNF